MKEIKNIEIINNTIRVNDNELLMYSENDDFSTFSKNAYKHFEINYPKFYKMSNMSKLGFLASEILLLNYDFSQIDKNKVAIILSCKSSSLNTDIQYQNSINDIPSPSLFVYTLPNIVTGEICIKHGFKGEEMMLVSETFDKSFQNKYVDILINQFNIELCIAGYIDIDENNNYFASLRLIEPNTNLKNDKYE